MGLAAAGVLDSTSEKRRVDTLLLHVFVVKAVDSGPAIARAKAKMDNLIGSRWYREVSTFGCWCWCCCVVVWLVVGRRTK